MVAKIFAIIAIGIYAMMFIAGFVDLDKLNERSKNG